jgi:hypothetical protein
MNIDDPEERAALQQEIQAAIAAGREVDPTMDKHLADSVLDRYAKERAARQRAVTRATPTPSPASPTTPTAIEAVGRMVMSVVAVAAFVAILLIRPEYFWLAFIFGPMLFGFWGRRGWGGHRHYRSYRHDDDYRNSNGPTPIGTTGQPSEYI